MKLVLQNKKLVAAIVAAVLGACSVYLDPEQLRIVSEGAAVLLSYMLGAATTGGAK